MLVLNRYILVVLLVISCVLVLPYFKIAQAQQESITITTYYPSPYGVYRNATVTDTLIVGTEMPLLSTTSIISGGYVRAPRFEDSDNTAWYIDPTGNAYISGSVGIRTTNPRSALQVASGYLQIESSAGPPPDVQCNLNWMRGRMVLDRNNDRLYICNGAARGWDYITLTD